MLGEYNKIYLAREYIANCLSFLKGIVNFLQQDLKLLSDK